MTLLIYIALVALFVLLPALVVWLCRRYPLFDRIGPIMLLYGVGIIIGNIQLFPAEMAEIQAVLPNVVVPLAIPMMLFSCTFSTKEVGAQLRVAMSGVLAVAIAVMGGYLIFGGDIVEGSKVGGILAGTYTGGTLNAAALQTIFKIDSGTFVLINSYDIIVSFAYFVFLFTVGIRLFRRLYGEAGVRRSDSVVLESVRAKSYNPYQRFATRKGLVQLAKIVGVALAIVVISAGVALPLGDRWFMVVFILMITTLGVAASFVHKIRTLDKSFDVGLYLIYIFSLAVASMADFSKFDLGSSLSLVGYMTFAVFVSLFIHALFCRLLRVDADSMVIASVAFINSPPFVPMVAAAMRNRRVLITGMGAGIIGYALGNHFGVLIERVLSLI